MEPVAHSADAGTAFLRYMEPVASTGLKVARCKRAEKDTGEGA